MAGEMYGAGSLGALGSESGDGTEQPVEGVQERSFIPEEYRDNPALKDVPDVGTLVKNYVEVQKFVGSSIKMPGEHATEDDWNKYVDRTIEAGGGRIQKSLDRSSPEYEDQVLRELGAPETADGYKVPEGLDGIDPKWLTNAKEMANKLNIPQSKFEQYVTEAYKQSTESVQASKQAREKDIGGLHQKWGADMSRRIDIAADFTKSTGAPAELQNLVTSGQANAATLEWLYNQAVQSGSEGQNIANQGYAKQADTPDDMRDEIRGLEDRMRVLDKDKSINDIERRDQQIKINERIINLRQKIKSGVN